MKRWIFALALLASGAGAARAQDVCAPARVTTLEQSLTGYSSYCLEWINTGDDGSTGNPASYEVRRYTSAITDTNWQLATIVDSGSASGNGYDLGVTIYASCPATTYYYVVFLFDEVGNRSPLGNVVAGAPRCTPPYSEAECDWF